MKDESVLAANLMSLLLIIEFLQPKSTYFFITPRRSELYVPGPNCSDIMPVLVNEML